MKASLVALVLFLGGCGSRSGLLPGATAEAGGTGGTSAGGGFGGGGAGGTGGSAGEATCFVDVVLGGSHSCARTTTGQTYCWGSNTFGQVGDGTKGFDRELPVAVLTPGPQRALGASDFHSCGVGFDGTVQCWGHNVLGSLGDGTFDDKSTPVAAVGVGNAKSAFVGTGHLQSCVVHDGGTASCWGSNDHGQVGDGTTVDTPVAHPVVGLNDATGIAVGYIFTCASRESGTVSCWGWNANGALGTGNGQADSIPVPVDVVDIDDGVQVVAGNHYACARSASGLVRCWGYYGHGQLGVGEIATEQVLWPTPVVGMTDAIWLAGGSSHACAVRENGHVACWGRNYYGQVGDGTTLDRGVPFEVPGIDDAVMVAAGGEHTCALSLSRGLLCWGANGSGQLGDGTSEMRLTPTLVACPTG